MLFPLTFGVCLLQLVSILGQTDKSGLYALGAVWDEYENPSHSLLYKFDVNTGNATLLHNTSTQWTKHAKSCFDDKLNIWYFIIQQFFNVSGDDLFDLKIFLGRYNLETYERLSDIPLFPYFSWIERVDCIGDPNTGDIYLFGNNGYNNTVLLQLITDNDYNVQINTIKDYGESIFKTKQIPFMGVQPMFDSKRNMVWFNGGSLYMWYYVNITNGDIIDTIQYETDIEFARSSIYYDKLDKIICLHYSFPYDQPNFDDGYWQLQYADPLNLTITDKMDGFKDYCPWYIHSPAIDHDNNIFYEFVIEPVVYPEKNYCPIQIYSWIFYTFHLLGIDINTGKILTQPLIYNDSNYAPYFAPADIIFWNGQ